MNRIATCWKWPKSAISIAVGKPILTYFKTVDRLFLKFDAG